MSQTETILQHLKKAPITPWQAMQRYRIMRLAARIQELKERGHNIITVIMTDGGKRFAEYHLIRKRGAA